MVKLYSINAENFVSRIQSSLLNGDEFHFKGFFLKGTTYVIPSALNGNREMFAFYCGLLLVLRNTKILGVVATQAIPFWIINNKWSWQSSFHMLQFAYPFTWNGGTVNRIFPPSCVSDCIFLSNNISVGYVLVFFRFLFYLFF